MENKSNRITAGAASSRDGVTPRFMQRRVVAAIAILLSVFMANQVAAASAVAAGVDPLAAEIDARDALRFAHLMKDNALPTAEILQRDYLDGAGLGVEIFTPDRIVDARHLARAIAARPDHYRYAIQNCLPQLPALRTLPSAICSSGRTPRRS
jgi:hypothetical protein